jgi:hypothetical protein
MDDVHDLHAPADRKHGHLALEGAPKRAGSAIALREGDRRLGMAVGAVLIGVDVGAAGEDQPVECVKRLLDRRLGRWYDQRPPARLLDRADVRERDQCRRKHPGSERRLLRIRRDSDDGPQERSSTASAAR